MDRLYTVIHYEYAKDVGINMVELYIIPDEELILYLNNIPKLEPQIFISTNGRNVDTNTIINCNYYASVDKISEFYETDTNYIVFIIFTNQANIIYKNISFPRSNIKQKIIKKNNCNEYTSFMGSKNPPLTIYNPLVGKFRKFKQFKSSKDVPNWNENECSHGICKAEQTTEPPLLNLLIDLSDK